MKSAAQKNIFLGMSGGVDSSVTALLLKNQGAKITGVFMKNWEEGDEQGQCPASTDMADAQSVCDQLGIELLRVNFSKEYWEHVFSHFLAEYKAGRTPNPDVLCNKEIKFKAFLDYAKRQGADYIATGHYARSRENASGKMELLKGLDPLKDQSYFLHLLNQFQLQHTLFPIGDLPKATVRQIAEKAGFRNHKKKDSTGICFIGERRFKTFLNEYLPAQPGPIETIDGDIIGRHDGLMFYTLGQRQGIQIGGQKNKPEAPWYVVSKHMETNTLVVAQGHDHPLLFTKTLLTDAIHWIGEPSYFPCEVTAKTRYRQVDQACILKAGYQVDFIEPQRAVTPGQSVVFYREEVCLGGGIIK